MRTAFTELVGVEAPLVGFNRSPGVVAAVSRAGGLGVLAATAYTPEQLDAQLTWIEGELAGRPYGVDLLVPAMTPTADPDSLVASLRAQLPEEHVRFVDELLARYDIPATPTGRRARFGGDELAANLDPSGVPALLDVVFAHPIALVANALGTPPPELVGRARAAGVAVAALVGKPEHARRQLAAGVDVLVAQGTEAGGHTGTIATMVLTPEIVDLATASARTPEPPSAAPSGSTSNPAGDPTSGSSGSGAASVVPVLAAGGIASGRQMAAALALGAAGVWCGSVWLGSDEDITPPEVKRKFLAASSSDTLRSPTRTGKPARQLRSAWHDEWERPGSPAPLPMPLQPLLVTDAWARIDAAAQDGNPGAQALESFFIGQVVGGFTALRPAEAIARRIVADCAARLTELADLVHP